MNREAAQETLETLQREIEKLDIADPETKSRIEMLVVDIEHQLSNPGDVQSNKNLVNRVEESAELFEADHPQLSGILNKVMNTLSNMGI